MCTAVTFLTKDHYFGRNLDLEFHYREEVTITPRNFPFHYRNGSASKKHYAMIGMATIANCYPLYYDATNETGLSMAGLNFPGNAVYQPCVNTAVNIAPFELIPWVLSQCATVDEAIGCINKINLAKIPFSMEFPVTPLHWLLADRNKSIVIEPMKDGIKIYDDPFGVLTNNPPFQYHLYHMTDYLNLTRQEPENRFSNQVNLLPYSRGMGAIGLPGDLSSASRFVRAAFMKYNSVCAHTENGSIVQFFHILEGVTQQEGCVRVGENFERTIYSSCCNTDRGIYYYRTYENSQINAVDMHKVDLDSNKLYSYPMITTPNIHYQNM